MLLFIGGTMTIFEHKLLDSAVKSEKLEKKEMIFGYLVGPSLMYLMTTALSGTYLMQFYTDVIGISGSLIVVMPLISKIAVAFMNIVFSSLINKTKTRQGKARPWLLLSGIILPIAGILLYLVPQADQRTQVLWILFSYNFFFVVAYNIYLLAHSMMIPRSSRDSAERDKLSLFKNVSEGMIPGTLSAVIMPFVIRFVGVGSAAQGNWIRFMLILSIIAMPAALFEYYYTKERVEDKNESIPLLKQFKESLHYKEWIIVILLIGIKNLEGMFFNSTMIYYCNWVLGNSVSSGANYQALFNVIGQFPLGIGVFMMWPLIRKFGKYDLMKYGFLLAAIGSAIALFNSDDFVIVLAGVFIRSIGTIPSLMSVSVMSDVIDRIEEKSGVRYDSLGASANSVLMNLGSGIAQSVVLLCINRLGYIIPSSAEAVIQQPEMLVNAFNFCMIGLPMILYVVSFLLVSHLKKLETK